MKRIFQCFTLLFLCFYTSIAQDSLKTHKVSSGETLFSIAKKYNITPYDLQKVNPKITHGISPDDVLLIPDSKKPAPIIKSAADSIKSSVVSSSISYTVKSGDTKYSIAKRFDLTISALESQNPQIREGLQESEVLEIFPAASYSKTSAAKGTTAPSPSSPTIKKTGPSADGQRHIVTKGETMLRIANAYGLTVEELARANSRVLTRGLIIGRPIWIPGRDQISEGDHYSHKVKVGDTKFGLSLRFNTTIAQLERHNPHIKNMLTVGDMLSMPPRESEAITTPAAKADKVIPQPTVASETEKQESTPVVGAPTPKTEPISGITEPERATEKNAEKSDTTPPLPEPEVAKEEIAKKPEPTPQRTEDLVQVEKPTAVTEKNATEKTAATPEPVDQKQEDVTKTDGSDPSGTGYLPYEIQANETLFGLAQSAGMSSADFLVLNPNLKEGVQAGTIIKMPASRTPVQAPSENVNSSAPERDFSLPVDLTSSANTSQLKRLLFFLPFSEQDYQDQNLKNGDFDHIPDDFKRANLEFYKGATIAIDSLKKLYLSLEIDILEAPTGLPNAKLKPLLEEKEITNYDAIILPFYETVEEEVATFTADHKIPVITASPLATQSTANNLYAAVPSLNLQRRKVLDYMLAKDAHIIVLNDANRTESKSFILDYAPQAEFVTIKKNGSFNEDELIAKFKKNQLNYVVIDSDRTRVFLNTTTTLLSELSNYNLQLAVLESALIPDEGHVSEKRYRILNMVFPSLIPAKSTSSSKQFLSDYQKQNNFLPSANVMLGFDITFDSLLRLIQQQSFEHSAINDITEYTQLKFNYKKNLFGGFSNEGIYILQYDSKDHIREAN